MVWGEGWARMQMPGIDGLLLPGAVPLAGGARWPWPLAWIQPMRWLWRQLRWPWQREEGHYVQGEADMGCDLDRAGGQL